MKGSDRIVNEMKKSGRAHGGTGYPSLSQVSVHAKRQMKVNPEHVRTEKL